MPVIRNKFPFFYQMQWQTLKTIWNSLHSKEVVPFFFHFLKERFRLQRSTFGKEWKKKKPTQLKILHPLDIIAFYIAYQEVTSHERALVLLLKILKQQSADVFLETVEVFRKYGIKIV